MALKRLKKLVMVAAPATKPGDIPVIKIEDAPASPVTKP